MEAIEKLTLAAMSLLLAGLASPALGPGYLASGEQKNYYAAVFLNRGQVSGGKAPNVGVFRRGPGDTLWANMYRPNLLTFGLGLWDRQSERRYYIAAGNGLHRSIDGGKTWRVLTDWHTEEVLSLALDHADPAIVYIATPFGVFKSTDDGRSWQRKTRGMKKWFVQKVLVDRKNQNMLYAAAEDDLYQTTSGGEQWTPLHVGVPGILNVVQDPTSLKRLLVGTEDHGIRISVDGGKTWKESSGLPNTAIYAIAFSPDNRTLYAGGYRTGIWMSNDGGSSWNLLWQNSDLEAVFTIFVHPQDPRHLLVGTSGQGIYESFDGGATWCNAGLQGCHVRQIELYP